MKILFEKVTEVHYNCVLCIINKIYTFMHFTCDFLLDNTLTSILFATTS